VTGVELAFEPDRPPAAEVKRLAIALADDALRNLEAVRHGVREEAVHEARKRFKEIRALLRLVPSGKRGERASAARRLIRNAGRALSATRDADILAESFEKLRGRFGSAIDASRDFQTRILAAAAEQALDTTAAVQLVGRARNDVALWILEMSADQVCAAVRRSYRASRRAMREALESRSAAAFHEWRKREKDHWYHARFLQASIPAMHAREPLLHRLSRILGDHHDLVIVRDAAARHASAADVAAAVNLSILARQRMRELETEAEAAGAAAFATPVDRFRAELCPPAPEA
jgi:hypothetical protein